MNVKGLVKFAEGAGNMEVREVEEPKILPGYVKIEVKATGICGSDIHILHSDIAIPVRPPVVTGHEFSGIVVEVGDGVTTCKVGDRVTSETAYQYCGKCENCKNGRYNLCDERKTLGYWYNGAFAKYTMVPQERIHLLKESISFEEAALLEPLACVCHAVMDLAEVKPTDIVLITGPGAVGLMTLQVIKAYGAKTIISGTNADTARLKMAEKYGADFIVNIQQDDLLEKVKQITGNKGADLVFECSGAPQATMLGIEAVKKYGQFVQVGLAGKPFELNFARICYKEIKVTGSLGSKWSSWDYAIRMVDNKQVKLQGLISNIYPLDKWREAFEIFENKKGLKILIQD